LQPVAQPTKFEQQFHWQGETEECNLRQRVAGQGQRQLQFNSKRAIQTEVLKSPANEEELQRKHKRSMQQDRAQLELQQPTAEDTAAIMMAAPALTRFGCDDFLNLPLADFRAAIATLPELSPAVIGQLNLERRRKRNRQYARRSRMRQSGVNVPCAGGGYARKINALKTFNSALRRALSQRSDQKPAR
jgi:hypothetical protein